VALSRPRPEFESPWRQASYRAFDVVTSLSSFGYSNLAKRIAALIASLAVMLDLENATAPESNSALAPRREIVFVARFSLSAPTTPLETPAQVNN
jgi:hypothetical protein